MIAFVVCVLVGTAVVVLTGVAIQRAMRRAKNRKPSTGAALWALLFWSSGRMPPPPPSAQIEEETGTKKNRAIGRDKAD